MFFHFSFVSFFLAPIPKNVQTVHFSHLAFGFDPPWSFWLKSENISAGVVALFWEEEKEASLPLADSAYVKTKPRNFNILKKQHCTRQCYNNFL